jgi:hypothetical protein
MRQVARDRRRMREDRHPFAFERPTKLWLGEQPVDTEFC